MKPSGSERSTFTPTSRYDAGTHANTAQVYSEPEPGADDTRPPEQQTAVEQTPATTLQPMPFPGPFAYTPIPAVAGQDGARTGAVTSTSTSMGEPGENTHGLTPLMAAAERGDLNEVNALIRSGSTDVNQLGGKGGVSALMLAAIHGSVEVAAALLAAGAQVNLGDAENGGTALILAAANGHAEVVQILLKHPGIDVDQLDSAGDTALMQATFRNKPDVVARLLAAGAQVNLAYAENGSTELICAAEYGDAEVVKILLKHPAIAVDQLDGFGNTALMQAALKNKPDVVACLLAAGAQVNLAHAVTGNTALICAAHYGHAEVVKILLKHPGIDVDQLDGFGDTALIRATFRNKPDVVARLLAAGAQVNLAQGENGSTALICAAEYGHAEVVQILLKHPGIDVDQLDGFGDTALMQATFRNKPDVVARLLAAGAQVNLAQGENGSTALICAAEYGHAEVVKILLKHPGIVVDQLNGFGDTALMRAAVANKPDVVACLLAAGAQVNFAHAVTGNTALTYAAQYGGAEIVQTLLKHPGIAVDQLNSLGDTALMQAVMVNKPDVVACLLAAGAQFNLAHDVIGNTALTHAAEYGHAEIVQTLLNHPGIAVDQMNGLGNTALMHATFNNKPDVVACLLAAGASMNLVNRGGKNALSLAVEKAHAATIEIFLQHGAQFDGQGPDFFESEPTPDRVAIADLCAERDMPTPELLAPVQAPAFFRELISTLREDGAMKPLMRWLRSKGIRMACAQQMAAALSGARAAWQSHPGSVKPANAQQQMVYCLSALGSLGMQGSNGKVLELYKTAGISVAAIERLGGTACRQLDNLASLALEVAAQVGGEMLNGLFDACMATTGVEYRVDANALRARLIQEGYCAPLAEAIALGWKEAIAGLQDQRSAIPDGLTLGQVVQFVHRQIVARAPAVFALAMQRQLDTRERLTALSSMMDGSNDEGLHALFQLQCDQLRQYCAQLLEVADPETLQSSNN